MLAATRAPATTTDTRSTGTTGCDSTPSWPATSPQAHRPATSPSGSPTTSPTRATVVACQATAADTWRRTKPIVRRMATSWRRRRTELISMWPTVRRATAANRAARSDGRWSTRRRFSTSAGRTARSTVPGKSCCSRRRVAARSTPGLKRTRNTFSGAFSKPLPPSASAPAFVTRVPSPRLTWSFTTAGVRTMRPTMRILRGRSPVDTLTC